jgi:hypothetical protein
MSGSEKRILNISEVRERLSDVREDALYRGAIVHWGDRGRDELVTLSRDLFQRLLEHGAESPAHPEEDPWAAFDAALAEGRLADSGDPAPRRRMPGLPHESSVPWNDIPALANTDSPPRRRRNAE